MDILYEITIIKSSILNAHHNNSDCHYYLTQNHNGCQTKSE